jgi:hypothetical protein
MSVAPPSVAGRLMDAQDMLAFSVRVEEEALMLWDLCKCDPVATRKELVDAACGVQDAVILGLCFAHLPPPRISCIISTLMPDYDGPCM